MYGYSYTLNLMYCTSKIYTVGHEIDSKLVLITFGKCQTVSIIIITRNEFATKCSHLFLYLLF